MLRVLWWNTGSGMAAASGLAAHRDQERKHRDHALTGDRRVHLDRQALRGKPLGPPCVGETHLAVAIGLKAIEADESKTNSGRSTTTTSGRVARLAISRPSNTLMSRRQLELI